MASVTTKEFTLHLPQDVLEMLRTAVTDRRETPDEIITEALRFSLQPVRQDALRQLKSQIGQQQNLSEIEIRSHLESKLTVMEQERLSQLLESNRAEGLTPKEQNEMQQLFDRIEAVATEKAAAIWLLSGKLGDSSGRE